MNPNPNPNPNPDLKIDLNNIDNIDIEKLKAQQGKTFVIKYGGNAMTDLGLQEIFAANIAYLASLGLKIIVVHGGGPQIDAALQKIGKTGEFVHGYRVTDLETLQAVEWALSGQVQPQILQLLSKYLAGYGNQHLCLGLSGRNHQLITAKKMYAQNPALAIDAENNPKLDIGWVGEVVAVNHEVLNRLLNSNMIPVVAPVAVDADVAANINVANNLQTYNVNADLVAAAIAKALNAEKLIMMSNIPAVLDADKQAIRQLTPKSVAAYVNAGVISGGMIPKIASSLEAIACGVKTVHIVDGREPHILLKQFEPNIGTLIVAD